MNKIRQGRNVVLFAALLSCVFVKPAFADSREKVGKVYLTIDSNAGIDEDGDDAEAIPSGGNTERYYVDGVEVLGEGGDFYTNASPPELEITLRVEDGEKWYFSGTSSSDFKLSLSENAKQHYEKVKFVSAKRRDSSEELILRVRLFFDEDADVSRAAAPSGVRWNLENGRKGVWEKVSGAKYYQVQLIKQGRAWGECLSIYGEEYDFSSLMEEPGEYCFQVRSVKSSNNAKSRWSVSDSVTLNGSAAEAGSWQKASDGIRWWWREADGAYPVSQWKEIEGKWYHFDAQGYMETGWVSIDEIYYYFDETSGEMYADGWTPDHYWVDQTGAYVPGR